jgi:hypothetical protein
MKSTQSAGSIYGTPLRDRDIYENHTEHINTLCGQNEKFSAYLTGNTLRLRYRAQPVIQYIRSSTTSRNIAVSIPDEFAGFFN